MLNKQSLDLIKSFEGLRLEAYKDVVGVWTIGYGHTSMAGPPTVKAGMKITEQEATDLLISDLKKYEEMVKRNVKVDLNENQYGALVSFTYNLGEGNLRSSTLLKKINAKDFLGASNEFIKWNKAGGQVLKGLTRRRNAEKALFLQPALLATEKPIESIPDVPAIEYPTPTETTPMKPTGWLELIKIFLAFFTSKGT